MTSTIATDDDDDDGQDQDRKQLSFGLSICRHHSAKSPPTHSDLNFLQITIYPTSTQHHDHHGNDFKNESLTITKVFVIRLKYMTARTTMMTEERRECTAAQV